MLTEDTFFPRKHNRLHEIIRMIISLKVLYLNNLHYYFTEGALLKTTLRGGNGPSYLRTGSVVNRLYCTSAQDKEPSSFDFEDEITERTIAVTNSK